LAIWLAGPRFHLETVAIRVSLSRKLSASTFGSDALHPRFIVGGRKLSMSGRDFLPGEEEMGPMKAIRPARPCRLGGLAAGSGSRGAPLVKQGIRIVN